MNMLTQVIVAAFVTGFMAQVVSEDKITAPIRDWVFDRGWKPRPQRDVPKGFVGDLVMRQHWFWKFLSGVVECYRCSGVWLSIPATLIVLQRWPWTGGWSGWWTFVGVMFAASFVQFIIMAIQQSIHGIQEAAKVSSEKDPPRPLITHVHLAGDESDEEAD